MNMTDEEIISAAEATGLKLFGLGMDKAKFEFCILAFAKFVGKIERFKEREDCAKVCEEYASANTSWTKAAVKDCAAIKEALAQPEQEPVAWSISPAVKGEDGRLYAYTNEKEWALSLVSKGHEIRPLVHGDTTLLQRTWVGLTDEERSELVTLHHGWNEYGQAIEAKLKEKNSA